LAAVDAKSQYGHFERQYGKWTYTAKRAALNAVRGSTGATGGEDTLSLSPGRAGSRKSISLSGRKEYTHSI
jgi:hypothetical protein